jgi:glucose uptake protein GlcU
MSTDNKNESPANGKQKMYIILLIIAGLIYSLYDGINSIITKNIWTAIPNLVMAIIIGGFLYIYFKKTN